MELKKNCSNTKKVDDGCAKSLSGAADIWKEQTRTVVRRTLSMLYIKKKSSPLTNKVGLLTTNL